MHDPPKVWLYPFNSLILKMKNTNAAMQMVQVTSFGGSLGWTLPVGGILI